MRPLRIELEGLFAYRERAVLDLTDVDYFSLEGPTGSGKSSLIDAMILALYGKVPRLGGSSVAPAISAGAERARVSLVFEAGDRSYTATRQLERTSSGGARATEARLQRGDEVMASGASDVTPAIVDLLRLDFDDFTRTVVLPQGDFARFLTATPKERQELLRDLLGLEVYREMASVARSRDQVARSEAAGANERLGSLPEVTEDAIDQAKERLAAIGELARSVPGQESAIAEAAEAVVEARRAHTTLLDAQSRLSRLEAPERLDELATLLADSDEAVDAAEAMVEELTARYEDLRRASADRASLEELDRIERLHERRAVLEEELRSHDVGSMTKALAEAEQHVASLVSELSAARAELDGFRTKHAAHALAGSLKPGDDCPVCGRTVESLASPVEIGELEQAESRVVKVEGSLADARNQVAKLGSAKASAETAVEKLEESLSGVLVELEGAPSRESIDALRLSAKKSIEEMAGLERSIETARKELTRHEKTRAGFAEEQRSLGRTLMKARDEVADLKPPIAESEDVLIQWKELISWKIVKLEELVPLVSTAATEIDEKESAAGVLRSRLDESLASQGIALEGSASAAVARAEEQARQAVERLKSTQEEAAALRQKVDEKTREADLAAALARHLRSDGFERWMMAGAIADLVSGANSILAQLSQETYSLHSDQDGSFDIVDHRNADEIRPISTLSGGETFLVSLALALSLAETLSAGSGSTLDAIILDEGFGTLDEESLDIVATVLESLTESGLMVGIITHVRALASRAPVRFQVTKGPGGSKVAQLT